MSNGARASDTETCFVVMGFGIKTDFESGRPLDLDKTYKNIIKPSVEAAGMRCVRADEIIHSGPIDVPMYEQLLNADVVVADLSTSNLNAYYELGVRHALKPYTTIIICEDGVKKFPFDIDHVMGLRYRHMGEDIGFDEVMRFREVLTKAIVEIKNQNPRRSDSPVYRFLEQLKPPSLADGTKRLDDLALRAASSTNEEPGEMTETVAPELYRDLMEEVDAAEKGGDFDVAKRLLGRLRNKMKPQATPRAEEGKLEQPEDPYIIRRLALVTYKAEQDTPEKEIEALREACDLLYTLNPGTSNDTETLGLWGAVHKRLWYKAEDTVALDKAIRSYERGFHIRNDYYNGINFAFLLNIRSAHSNALARAAGDAQASDLLASAIADFVQARRVRKEVLSICDRWLKENSDPEELASDVAKQEYLKNKYWVLSTKAEAILGMGKSSEAELLYDEAFSLVVPPWMVSTTRDQKKELEALLADSPIDRMKPSPPEA